MAGISSKAAEKLENKKKYAANEFQNGEFIDGTGLEFYDFNARTYDQQLGRFHQIDPLADEESQENWTPYHYCFNNPILQTDPDGRNPGILFQIGRALFTAYRTYKAAQKIKEFSKAEPKQASKEVVIPMIITTDANGRTVVIPEADLAKFTTQVKTEKLENINKELKGLDKSNRSLEKRVAEHEQKLEDYQNEPEKFDNKELLKNATPEQRKSIIDKRIAHLKKEIETFKNNISKNNRKVQELTKQKQELKTND